ncbi:MAG TPA: hypothetical protein VD862_01510 [Candidatus Paceibacterota bacterium]|nr:hypothetical protein [Candidatus Paceibacterota bacterium]
MFTPRPGWGGQLLIWLRSRKGRAAVRGLVLVGIAAVAAPLIRSGTRYLAPEPTPAPSPSPVIAVPVPEGGGVIHAARLALYEYLALQPVPLALEPDQALYAEDWLARRMEVYAPAPGQLIEFPREVLAAAVLKAQSLSPSERAAWGRLLR